MTEQKIAEMLTNGFKRWTKGNLDRLYINATQLGLVLTYYKTGNIRSAEFNGDPISNSEGRRMKEAKTFIDVKTGNVYSDNNALKNAVQEMLG